MNTNSCYDIKSIIEFGNKAKVKYTISEGYWETIITEEETQQTFIRDKILFDGTMVFNYYPVPQADIDYAIRNEVPNYSSLPLCF